MVTELDPNGNGNGEKILRPIDRVTDFLRGIAGMRGRVYLPEEQRRIIATSEIENSLDLFHWESREHEPRVFTFPLGNGDVMTTFSGRAYLENLYYLIGTASVLASRNIGWDLGYCMQLMTKSMGVLRLTGGKELTGIKEIDNEIIDKIVRNPRREREIPSAFLLRREDVPEGQYLGISVQRMFYLMTETQGEVPALYHVLRAIEEDFRGSGRGRKIVGHALLHHRGAQIYFHKSANTLALKTNTKSEYLNQEEGRVPWDGSIDEIEGRREIYNKIIPIVLWPGAEITPYGVVINNYPQPAKGFNPDDLHGDAIEFHKRIEELGVNPRSPVLASFKVK